VVDLKLMRARAERAFPDRDPQAVLNKVRAIVGSQSAMPPNEEGRLAASAFAKLTDDDGPNPTPAELAALELMIRMTRPAPLFHKGRPDDFKSDQIAGIFPHWDDFQRSIQPLAHAVGRVDRAAYNRTASETIGTGFKVAPELFMTNRHVLMQLSRGTSSLEEGQGVVRFQWEDDSFDPDKPWPILGVVAIHGSLDVVLLRLKAPPEAAHLPLPGISEAKLDANADLVVAGYPAQDEARNPLFVRTIFGTSFEVLRASPGQLTGFEASGFTHDCSTLGGNSGSPVFSMATAEVVGLHRSGAFLWSNQAVDGVAIGEFLKVNA
jgi:hypothetical protein